MGNPKTGPKESPGGKLPQESEGYTVAATGRSAKVARLGLYHAWGQRWGWVWGQVGTGACVRVRALVVGHGTCVMIHGGVSAISDGSFDAALPQGGGNTGDGRWGALGNAEEGRYATARTCMHDGSCRQRCTVCCAQ